MRYLAFLPFTIAACSSAGSNPGESTAGGSGAGGASGGAAGSAGAAASAGAAGSAGGLAGGMAGTGGGGGGAGGLGASGVAGSSGSGLPTLIYAHTDTTLYQLDPASPKLSLTKLGDFDCVPGKTTAMTDVAVNDKGDLWGLSSHAVWPLTADGTVAKCGAEIKLSNTGVQFYALTFTPAGVLDPVKEVLVAGNTAGELWSIDASGVITQRGTFGKVPVDDGNGHKMLHPGGAWELSGDVVFLANGGKPVGFATVRDCPNPPDTTGCNPLNTLLEIDVPMLGTTTTGSVTKAVRGQIVTRAGCTDGKNGNYGNMYGIAAWNDRVYGFSRSGNLVEIATKDGTGCLVEAYPTFLFSGAGVTTLAPIIPPEPK